MGTTGLVGQRQSSLVLRTEEIDRCLDLMYSCAKCQVSGALLLGLIAWPAHAQVADRTLRAERYVRSEMRTQHIPGMALAVLKQGKPLYIKAFGNASLEWPETVRPDTRFQIGSIGKQFTAVAVMLMVHEHRLSLDDPLSNYLPEVPPTWHEVTLRRMLNHQSGIAQLTVSPHNLLDLHHDYTDAEYVQLASSVPLDFKPGTAAAYSDTAYVLLGIVLNRVNGAFYGDLLEARIFRPLGMRRTRILSDDAIIPGRASGYVSRSDGTLENQSWVAAALNRTADGSLYSTVLDLSRWDAALYGDRVLPQVELQRMWSVDPLVDGRQPLYHYGYGWEINSLHSHRVIEYDGNWQGFQAAMARYTDRQLSVIVLTNLALCRTQRIAHTIAGIFDASIAPYGNLAQDFSPELTHQFRNLLVDPVRGGVGQRYFHSSVRERYAASWRAALASELRGIGPIGRFELAEERRLALRTERVYRLETRDMTDWFIVLYDQDQLIHHIDLYREF